MTATATFEYKVRDRGGKLTTGKLDAETPSQVASKLKAMGYSPLSITRTNAGLAKEITIPGFGDKKVKLKDLAVFSRQFATMINAGLSLLRSLTILQEQSESKALQRVLGEVRNDIESGNSLSASMGKYPEVFPPLMVNMCRAGEVGGFLDTVLLRIADNFEADAKLRGKIKSAMTYPVAVLFLAMGAVAIMLTFIVPVFAKMFASLGGQLPAPTKLLVSLSNNMGLIAPMILFVGVGGFLIWKKSRYDDRVRSVVDPLKLRMPVFGDLFKKIALSRFCRNLGTMVRSGVPILQALEIVSVTTGNIVMERAIRDVQNSVRQGESLSAPLKDHPIFPPMVVQMMSVGEDAGALDTMLEKISEFYDQEVEATTESLTALLEPLMIAFLGGIIGSIIVALYLPMFKIFDKIN